jgi:acyl carrier protein
MNRTNEERRRQITEVMSEVLRISPDIVAKVTPVDVEVWDSQTHVALVVALEEQFGVMFEPEDVPELTSLDSIEQTLERYGA